MYNGIGLQTARGSGTNGYVQRNLAFIKHTKDKTDYKSEEELKKLDARINRGPNEEILLHERKRKVELKCLEMQELMAETGYSQEEIDKKVAAYRQKLMENQTDNKIETNETSGRPIAKASHQLAEASQVRNENLRLAFGISEFYKDGSSFDPERKAKEEAAKLLATKKYSIIEDDSESEDEVLEDKDKQKKKKTRKRHRSQSPSSKKESKKKREESPIRKEKHHSHKSSHKSRKEKRSHRHD